MLRGLCMTGIHGVFFFMNLFWHGMRYKEIPLFFEAVYLTLESYIFT